MENNKSREAKQVEREGVSLNYDNYNAEITATLKPNLDFWIHFLDVYEWFDDRFNECSDEEIEDYFFAIYSHLKAAMDYGIMPAKDDIFGDDSELVVVSRSFFGDNKNLTTFNIDLGRRDQ